jgi:hypothetical protein
MIDIRVRDEEPTDVFYAKRQHLPSNLTATGNGKPNIIDFN